jgi:small-conductance mechanosensitive channel
LKRGEKAILVVLLALLIVALGAVIYTRSWSDYGERLQVIEKDQGSSQLVDMHPLDTAHQLVPLAVTRTERDYSQEALRLGDHAVDLAFDSAMRDATENPAPLTTETRQLSSRVKKGDAGVGVDQARVAQLTQQLAKAGPAEKDVLQEDLGIAQAQLDLDQDELEDAHQDLIRMGGDKRALIQQLIDQHEASETHLANASPSALSNAAAPIPSPAANTVAAIETSASKSLVAQAQAWWSLRSKQKLLAQAQMEALSRIDKLTDFHEALESQLDEEKAQKKIIHKGAGAEPSEEAGQAGSDSSKGSTLSFIRHLTQDQKNLSEFDKRIGFEKQLAAVYGDWVAYTTQRERSFLHAMIVGVFLILLIGVLALMMNYFTQRIFAGIALERRQLHTIRAVVVLSTQTLGILFILLVIFGMPSNLATVLALAGAGLTVTMKDFIVGFFGWFVLMGRNGIRPGDWVEINGVGGEVTSVGLLHTVLLETGSWSDAGYPTGRKVSFVNSYAIEGHYFNFSTSGQWLWDQIEVQIPESAEPYQTAEAIQKIVADATAPNAHLAEEEWNRITPNYAKRGFSATPSMSIQPAGAGIKVLVRYITRPNDRRDVRVQIYRAVVELLHKKQIPESAARMSPDPSATDRG